MTCRGHIINGQIALDDAVRFPECAEVVVMLVENQPAQGDDLISVLLRHAGRGENLPEDLAEQHDHYSHGKPMR